MRSLAGDKDMEGAEEIGAANGMACIASITHSIPATATAGDPLECNVNGKIPRSAQEASRAPSHWGCHNQRAIRQRTQKLTQMVRNVAHLANLLDSETACEEAQWLGMITWMQEREQTLDTRHENVKMLGAGMTARLAMIMKGVAPSQEAREKGRDKTAKMEGGGLEAS